MAWPSPVHPLRLENAWVVLQSLQPESEGSLLWSAASPETNGTDLFLYHLGTGPFGHEAEFLAWLDKKARHPTEVTLSVFSRRLGRPVGSLSLLNPRPDHGVVEVGSVWYTKAAQKTEVNTNAIFLVACYVFDTLGYRRLEWKCNHENQDSERAALRLGFRYEGLFRHHFWDKGRNRDTAWFSITDEDWPSVKERFETVLLPSPRSTLRP